MFRRLTREEAQEVINYLKTLALYEANTRQFYMEVTDYRDKDEEHIPMLTLKINIAIDEG